MHLNVWNRFTSQLTKWKVWGYRWVYYWDGILLPWCILCEHYRIIQVFLWTRIQASQWCVWRHWWMHKKWSKEQICLRNRFRVPKFPWIIPLHLQTRVQTCWALMCRLRIFWTTQPLLNCCICRCKRMWRDPKYLWPWLHQPVGFLQVPLQGGVPAVLRHEDMFRYWWMWRP